MKKLNIQGYVLDILADADLRNEKLREKEIIIRMEPYVKRDKPDKEFCEKNMQSKVNKSLKALIKQEKIKKDAGSRYSLCETELPKENVKSRINAVTKFVDKQPKRVSANTYVIEIKGDLIATRNLLLDYFGDDVYEIFPNSFGYLFLIFNGNKDRISKALDKLKEVMRQ